jgi:hypothetical protein
MHPRDFINKSLGAENRHLICLDSIPTLFTVESNRGHVLAVHSCSVQLQTSHGEPSLHPALQDLHVLLQVLTLARGRTVHGLSHVKSMGFPELQHS